MTQRVRVYLACSLDGFIAGPDDDVSWLDPPDGGAEPEPTSAIDFASFMADVGCLLMGRRTYDVANRLIGDAPWHYGETPILVATHHPLEMPRPTARPVAGSIGELLTEAKSIAAGEDVYLDGGDLVRQGLDAGLVDELVLTIAPVILGAGVRLFDGVARHPLELVAQHPHPYGMAQLVYAVRG